MVREAHGMMLWVRPSGAHLGVCEVSPGAQHEVGLICSVRCTRWIVSACTHLEVLEMFSQTGARESSAKVEEITL